MAGYFRKQTPSRRYCADCGVFVGYYFKPFTLCESCKRERLQAAQARTQERNKRHGRE